MFENCLICTDFKDGLHRFVNFIPDLANNGLKRIVFLHSISVWQDEKIATVDEDKINVAKQRLSPALDNIPDGLDVQIEVLSGNLKDKILALIDQYNIQVVLTGMPTRNALEARIFGSHTLELAPSTSTPLMILRPQLISTYTCEELSLRCQHLWRYLLIPYNDSQSAQYLIERVQETLQHQHNGSVKQCLLLWVIDEGGRSQELVEYHLQEAHQKLNTVKEKLEAFDLTVTTEVRQGNPLQEILDAALHYDISAIAIASDYRNNLFEWTVPSLANDVLNRSWFPVLYFSPKR